MLTAFLRVSNQLSFAIYDLIVHIGVEIYVRLFIAHLGHERKVLPEVLFGFAGLQKYPWEAVFSMPDLPMSQLVGLDAQGEFTVDTFKLREENKTPPHKAPSRQWTDISFRSSLSGDIGLSSQERNHSNFLNAGFIRSGGLLRNPDSRTVWMPSKGKAPCGKQLSDSNSAALIYGLARALLVYGAPLYRVERRITEAGEGLGITTSVLCLPSAILITLGDGSVSQPTRTHFLEANNSGFNMGKLQEVDQLAIRCANLRLERGSLISNANESKVKPHAIKLKKNSALSIDSLTDKAAVKDSELRSRFLNNEQVPSSNISRESLGSDFISDLTARKRFDISGRRSEAAGASSSTAGFDFPPNLPKSGSILASAHIAQHKDDSENPSIMNEDAVPVIDLQRDSPQASTRSVYYPSTGIQETLNVPNVFELINPARLSTAGIAPFLSSSVSRRPSYFGKVDKGPVISVRGSPRLPKCQSEASGSRQDSSEAVVEQAVRIIDMEPFKERFSVLRDQSEPHSVSGSVCQLFKEPLEKASQPPLTLDDVAKILEDLDHVVTRRIRYRTVYRGSAFAIQACMITLLIYRGSLADAALSAILGSFVGLSSTFAERFNLQSASDFIIALAVAVLARFAERAWPGNQAVIDAILQSNSSNLSNSMTMLTVNTTTTANVFPGTDGSSGMGNSSLIASWIDSDSYIFYGVYACYSTFSLASLAQLLPGASITLGMLELSTSPVAGSVRIFQSFIRALKLGYGLTLGSKLAIWFMTGLSVPLADFGVQSDSRQHCPEFRFGISWLVPGSVGVQTTFGLFHSSSDWTPGATFGMDMITRAMSIAVGLYMANAHLTHLTPPGKRQISSVTLQMTPEALEQGSTQKRVKGEPIEAFLKRASHMSIVGKGVEVMENLTMCRNLSVLYLYDNRITAIVGLECCKNLTRLYLQNNQIEEIEGLDCGLDRLTDLHLSGNKISLITGLHALPSLETLHVDHQKTSVPLEFDVASMEALSASLKHLTATSNRIKDLTPLTALCRLEDIDISNNDVSDWEI
ncbi:hypothetical protein HDU67_003220 [Dinochytrium kinnereticum]|nr:hypothetical protein HDU67_003220 [Dinochytrium kinnereticum]